MSIHYLLFYYYDLFKKLELKNLVPFITLLIIILGTLQPDVFSFQGTSYFALVLVLVGIIHGASDYFIYKALGGSVGSSLVTTRFNILYLVAILAYAMIWYYFTEAAMFIFICVSIYHFGQSNWNQYHLPKEHPLIYIVYVMWGAFVTLTPLLLHFKDSINNLTDVLIIDWKISEQLKYAFLYSILIVNILLCCLLWGIKKLDAKSCIREIVNVFILFGLFSVTPLLFGFAIYFTLWHSTYSTKDQITLLKTTIKDFSIQKYFRSLFSMSLISFIILGLVYYLFTNVLGLYFGWGMLFLFISLLTLPHSYIIHKFFEG